MHIPDGFLATPVWAGSAAASLLAVGFSVRKVQREMAESSVPRLGVMGAFVFAAQMINFPIAAGTSGHLVGSALLTYTLGPEAAVLVMAAVLVLQALVFQDGGILALGANVWNMALAAVLVAHLCYRGLGADGAGKAAIFAGGALSVLVAGMLALAELALSGIAIPVGILAVGTGLLALNGIVEGILTVAIVQALERLNPGWIRAPADSARPALRLMLAAAIVLATAGVLVASAAPDSLEWLAEETGLAERARALFETPFAEYEVSFIGVPWLAQAAAGVVGLAAVFGLTFALGRLLVRRRG